MADFPVSFQSLIHPARNPHRFRGSGTAAIEGQELRLSGKQARPFWFSRRASFSIPLNRIRDVLCQDNKVSFETDPYPGEQTGKPSTTVLFLKNAASAAEFAAALPARLSKQAARERSELAEFESRLTPASRAWVTLVLVAANLVVYAIVGVRGGGWFVADGKMLIEMGSNFGPITSGGDWWRLLTATFLHGGLVHLLVNMAALYDVGRLCERLYGSGRFLALYVTSGLLGSAASLWWNPPVNSVGASGAVFGIVGAAFIYMLDKKNGVPLSVMKQHQATLTVLILYTLVNGFSKAGIDNAAHVGGLAAGLVLGYAFAQPLGGRPSSDSPWARPAAGLAACLFSLAVLLTNTPNTRPQYDIEQRFLSDLRWFETEEQSLLGDTKAVLFKASKSGGKLADMRGDFAKLSAKWDAAHDRFAAYRPESSPALDTLHQDVVLHLDLRRRAFGALAGMPADGSMESARAAEKEFIRLWKESAVVVDRMNNRAQKKPSSSDSTRTQEKN